MAVIQRIHSYIHPEFSQAVLNQHGAFLIDGIPCAFEIVGVDLAQITTSWSDSLDEVIDEFREYAQHITRFIDADNHVIKEFEPIPLIKIPIALLQPSQFYINQEKLRAIGTWIVSEEQVIIPVVKMRSQFVVADGHTRLYAALKHGIQEAYMYIIEEPAYLSDFVSEALILNIKKIDDLQELDALEYEKKWIDFCKTYFSRQP